MLPALRELWDWEKTLLHEICVSGTVGGPLLAHLHVRKPKVVETVFVIFV